MIAPPHTATSTLSSSISPTKAVPISPIDRPSPPVFNQSTSVPPISLASQRLRTELRIITSLPSSLPVHRPIPTRATCKTAPLPSSTRPTSGDAYVSEQDQWTVHGHDGKGNSNREVFVLNLSDYARVTNEDQSGDRSSGSHNLKSWYPAGFEYEQHHDGSQSQRSLGHKRRLSDKFKDLLLRASKKNSISGEIEEDRTPVEVRTARRMDENTLRRQQRSTTDSAPIGKVERYTRPSISSNSRSDLNEPSPPSRPHRSPGTASFLVTRHSIERNASLGSMTTFGGRGSGSSTDSSHSDPDPDSDLSSTEHNEVEHQVLALM
ncbi:hypothetical protein CI109_106377 [Kwoniella shandongensis]|uniref:Uncharacterized protein n=1 Tax=Kwoniella shandongensis TaxID=1734106 RepID=A0A5M6BSG0_9TREE|nr:uncharacterized protein CI109_005916 [Kwoniella shandongensis]KAA5525753.1 hypothetical protein CI109_005916 [Kwoniella shandongensis]